MTNIPTDRPLAEGDVPLLREGDVLRCEGVEVTFMHSNFGVVHYRYDAAAIGSAPHQCFTFVRRPAASDEGVVDSSHGSVYDSLLTLIHDRDDALRGDDRTDPGEIDEAVLEIMKITSALASPPVSERERDWFPISDAPRQEAVLLGSERLKGWFRVGICNALGEWSYEDRPWSQQDPLDAEPTHFARLSAPRALTAQPAGEPTHG